MIATVVTVVYTHNLAIGVLVGVLLSGIFFAGKIAQLFKVTSTISKDGRERTYIVEGQLFYGSVEDFMNADEIFQTGNYSKVVPVTRLDDAQFQEGPVTRKALELYMDWAKSTDGTDG
jgi:branched-subunit amino acid aminotransferase/4-amino-4-deoxychorismate lyase